MTGIIDDVLAQVKLDRGQPYWSDRLDWLDHVEQWLNSLKDWGWPNRIPVAADFAEAEREARFWKLSSLYWQASCERLSAAIDEGNALNGSTDA